MIEKALEGFCQLLRIAVAIQTSVMMQVNLLVIYITVPFAGFCWAVFSTFRLWLAVQEYRHGPERCAA